MSFFSFARRRNSAPVARERLQILLEYERRIISQSDLVAVLRQEILAVVGRHVSVDPDKVRRPRLTSSTAASRLRSWS